MLNASDDAVGRSAISASMAVFSEVSCVVTIASNAGRLAAGTAVLDGTRIVLTSVRYS